MVSINGLPPRLPPSGKASKTRRRSKTADKAADTIQKSPVASAVAQSVRTMADPELESAHLHYDLPEGRARKALAQYYAVMDHGKREELAKMMGLDIYI